MGLNGGSGRRDGDGGRGRCDRVEETLRAARSGAWTPAVERHADACPVCADALLVERALAADGAQLQRRMPPAGRALDAGAIWRRARAEAERRERERALERATRPIRWVRRLSLSCGAAVAAWATGQMLPVAEGVASRLGSIDWGAPDAGAGGMVAAGLVVVWALVSWVYTAWADA